ncbi:MAG: hypothetical protein ACI9XJ_002194, partial [Marivirga sp.]
MLPKILGFLFLVASVWRRKINLLYFTTAYFLILMSKKLHL